MTAAAPVTDAPATMVKTCRREIPCDPVMTRRSCYERQSVSIIANRFAWRRANRAQTRRNGFCLRLIAQRRLDATRDTSARLYKIDHLSFSVRARSIAVEEAGHAQCVEACNVFPPRLTGPEREYLTNMTVMAHLHRTFGWCCGFLADYGRRKAKTECAHKPLRLTALNAFCASTASDKEGVAKALGLDIPGAQVATADEVIG